MRPELVVDIARIQADFVHIFAENGGAMLNEAVGWQSQVRRIVNVAISSETVEACHAERLALKQKSQWVAEAIAGLQPIFGVVACTGVGGIPGAFIGQRVQRANGNFYTLVSYDSNTRMFSCQRHLLSSISNRSNRSNRNVIELLNETAYLRALRRVS